MKQENIKESPKTIKLKSRLNKAKVELERRKKAAMLHTGGLFHKINADLIIKRATPLYPYSPDELKQYHQIMGLAVKFKKWRDKGKTKQLNQLEQLGIEFLQAKKTTKKKDVKNGL